MSKVQIVDATAFVEGEAVKKSFKNEPLSTIKDWAIGLGAETLETASAPYREEDRRYYVYNPGTHRMNRASFRKAGTVTGTVRRTLGMANLKTKKARQKRVKAILHDVVSGMSTGPGVSDPSSSRG